MELELCLEQASSGGVGREEDELRILAAARVELQGSADVCAQTLVAVHTAGQSHQVFNFVREVLFAWCVGAVVEQCSAKAFEFGRETREQTTNPGVVRYQRDASPITITERALRGGHSLVFGCQAELIQAWRCQRIVRQIIQG